MNYTRYDVRNAIHRKKKGLQPTIPEIIEIIEPLMRAKKYEWHSFSKLWDVVIHKQKGILVVPNITDLPSAESVCSQMKIVSEMNVDKEWNEEETAVIENIEAQFLDGIMDWTNYRDEWGIRKNSDTDKIETYLLKRKPLQNPVTQEMIDAKIGALMSSKTTEEAREEINTVQTIVNLGE
jgi:hypothetical protein